MLGFNLQQTFFGFKPEDRIILHESIFNLIWHGEGRWDWDTIYNMPIFLRRFYVNRVNTIIEDRITAQKQRAEQAKRKRAAIPNSPR
jgi:hypothetical protein